MIIPKYYCVWCRKFKKRNELIKYKVVYTKFMCKNCHRTDIINSKKYLEKIICDYKSWEDKDISTVDLRSGHGR